MLEACACHLPPHLPRRRLGLPAKLDLPGPSCLVGFYQISFISPIPLVLLSLLYLLYLSLPKLAGTFIPMRAILARTTFECGDLMSVHMSVHIPVHICPRRRSGISDLPDRRCLPGSDGPVTGLPVQAAMMSYCVSGPIILWRLSCRSMPARRGLVGIMRGSAWSPLLLKHGL